MADASTAPECEAARETLSALLDGEDPGLSTQWLTTHLVDCAPCRDWYAAATELKRRTRLVVAPDIPDLAPTILARLDQPRASSPTTPRRATTLLIRLTLAVIALVQLALSAPLLLQGGDPDLGIHHAHELGSFEMALGIGLLYAAWRPPAARGVRPLVAVLAVLLVVTALIDLAQGRTTYVDEAPHLLTVAGFIALSAITRSPVPGSPDTAAVGRPPLSAERSRGRRPRPRLRTGDELLPPGQERDTGTTAMTNPRRVSA